MRFARTTNVARKTFIGAGIVLNESCREKLNAFHIRYTVLVGTGILLLFLSPL
jgi:hypothetical protein